MKFNNVENEAVKLPDGRTVWLSRSMAVVANVWYIGPDMLPHVLMGKRGPGTPDEQGKWVLPCGYLDYNETLAEAALREVYEETGLDLGEIFRSDNYSTNFENLFSTDQPYFVNSTPGQDKKQNISSYFGFVFTGPGLPELSMANCAPGEVEDLRWVPLNFLYALEIGFNHLQRIHDFYEKYIKA